MKKLSLGIGMSLLVGLLISCASGESTIKESTMEQTTSTASIYDIKINKLDGTSLDLSSFKGKKILFVNVASECGFTPQYADLQKLYEEHSDKVEIIGVPCNQFGGQEPGEASEIAQFCERNYGVTFTITEKVDVKGDDQHPLYAWLTSKEKNGVMDATVKWNFHKFLVNEEGELIQMYGSRVNPLDDELLSEILK